MVKHIEILENGRSANRNCLLAWIFRPGV